MTLPGPPIIRRHRLVGQDITDIADYIGGDNADAALRFFDAVDVTLLGLAGMPGKGPRCAFKAAALADVRFYTVDGFPNHLIFYRPMPYGIFVLSVRHGARRLPGDLAHRT